MSYEFYFVRNGSKSVRFCQFQDYCFCRNLTEPDTYSLFILLTLLIFITLYFCQCQVLSGTIFATFELRHVISSKKRSFYCRFIPCLTLFDLIMVAFVHRIIGSSYPFVHLAGCDQVYPQLIIVE